MIYLQKGLRHNQLNQVKTALSDWQWLVKQAAIKAPFVNSKEKASRYKQDQGQFVITGKLTGQKRNNQALINRSILFFDIDGTHGDEYAIAARKLHSAFKDIAYLIYPTVSNGYKGTRLRAAIPISQSFNAAQRAQLGAYLAQLLPDGWQTDLTSYDSNWSQLAGLPVLNAYSLEYRCHPISCTTAPFLNLKQMLATSNPIMIRSEQQPVIPLRESNRFDRQSWQDITNNVLTSLANPPETNRHTYYSSLVGSLLFMKTDPSVITTLLFWSNSHSNNPLPYNELQRTIHSVSRTAKRKQQVNG